MAYYLNLFTPETWSLFRERGARVSSFTKGLRTRAHTSIKPNDIFVCYLAKVKRWCGVLRIVSDAYDDDTSIDDNPMPWVVHFDVEPVVILDPEHSIPIENDEIWYTLSITKNIKKGAMGWGANIASSLRTINDSDGDFLVSCLKQQQQDESRIDYPLTDEERRRLQSLKVRTPDGEVSVEVPEGDEEGDDAEAGMVEALPSSETRESIQVQARIAEIGAKMGFRIWVPRSDRDRVLAEIEDSMKPRFLENLPLNYDDTTLQTIERIDIIWLKGRSMARAFEVEHTTAVYSGLLRMADLLALQPNMDIRLHIVAPDKRREKVLREIKRPVFSLLERGPLYKNCTFLSYGTVEELGNKPDLEHMNDSIIEEYEEYAQDY